MNYQTIRAAALESMVRKLVEELKADGLGELSIVDDALSLLSESELTDAPVVYAVSDVEAVCPHCHRTQSVPHTNIGEIATKDKCWKCEKPFRYIVSKD